LSNYVFVKHILKQGQDYKTNRGGGSISIQPNRRILIEKPLVAKASQKKEFDQLPVRQSRKQPFFWLMVIAYCGIKAPIVIY